MDSLKPQDLLVASKLFVIGRRHWTYLSLGEALAISSGEVHHSVKRCCQSGLASGIGEDLQVDRRKLFEALSITAPLVYFVTRGKIGRGMPTGILAPMLSRRFDIPGRLVWPVEDGDVEGEEIRPIYPSIPEASRRDPTIYEIMALVDILRAPEGSKHVTRAKELLSKRILGG
jgi:hypothetical protein